MSKKRALISVSNKGGLAELAEELVKHEIEIIASTGTGNFLQENGISFVKISDVTQFEEMLGGRVKTLHPSIYAGILFDRKNERDIKQIQQAGITPIDFVIVDLYPFESVVRGNQNDLQSAIENIDIGGTALLRSASKNYQHVTAVSNIEDYPRLIKQLQENQGSTNLAFREEMAIKAFKLSANYNSAISNYLSRSEETLSSLTLTLPLSSRLRYGENPHQSASLYGNFTDYFTKIHGKELSYTNVLDIGNAASLISEFKRSTTAIFKHTNPCGVGCSSDSIREAWLKAYETDKQAPFGGVIALNRPMSEDLARVISGIFTDVIIATDFSPGSRAILQKKSKLRLIIMNENVKETISAPIMRSVVGGLLVQDADPVAKGLTDIENKVVTDRPPSKDEIEAMRFGWRVAKYVKSNAIVFSSSDRTLGIGAGQMSRVDSVTLAILKAKQAGLSLQGSTIASDAMFPFPDGLEAGLKAGATSAIQPGGSIKDKSVIAIANEHKATMVFTGYRHFLH